MISEKDIEKASVTGLMDPTEYIQCKLQWEHNDLIRKQNEKLKIMVREWLALMNDKDESAVIAITHTNLNVETIIAGMKNYILTVFYTA